MKFLIVAANNDFCLLAQASYFYRRISELHFDTAKYQTVFVSLKKKEHITSNQAISSGNIMFSYCPWYDLLDLQGEFALVYLFTSNLFYTMENTDSNPITGFELLLAYIAKSIRERRRKNKLSQNQLAQRSGIILHAVQQMEHGRQDFKLLEIAKVLKTEIKSFFP